MKLSEKAAEQWKQENPGYEPMPGAVVGHPDEKLSYEVESVSNGQAFCFCIKDGVRVEKMFSCKELLDVRAIYDMAILIKLQRDL